MKTEKLNVCENKGTENKFSRKRFQHPKKINVNDNQNNVNDNQNNMNGN